MHNVEQLTAHFRRVEFACRGVSCCSGSAPIAQHLVYALEAVRAAFGKPLFINSGFRCRTHNDQTPGSVPNSRHTLGLAADVVGPNGEGATAIVAIAAELGIFESVILGKNASYAHLAVAQAPPERHQDPNSTDLPIPG